MKKPLALGIIGHPIGHSLSPLMQGMAGTAAGVALTYTPFAVHPDNLATAIEGVRALSIDGFNVTVPHKQAIMPLLDTIDDEAQTIGAVNTVVNRKGKLAGYNSDGYGFITPLVERGEVAGKRALVLGAGGAARAVVASLAGAGLAEIHIANRTTQHAETLATGMAKHFPAVTIAPHMTSRDKWYEFSAGVDIIVNTTTLGMIGGASDDAAFDRLTIKSDMTVVDIVYNPLRTPFLTRAEKVGATTIDGLWMLIHQGAKAFELFTGVSDFPVEKVRAELLAALAGGVAEESI